MDTQTAHGTTTETQDPTKICVAIRLLEKVLFNDRICKLSATSVYYFIGTQRANTSHHSRSAVQHSDSKSRRDTATGTLTEAINHRREKAARVDDADIVSSKLTAAQDSESATHRPNTNHHFKSAVQHSDSKSRRDTATGTITEAINHRREEAARVDDADIVSSKLTAAQESESATHRPNTSNHFKSAVQRSESKA